MDPITLARTTQIVVSLARSRTVRTVAFGVALIQVTVLLVLMTAPADHLVAMIAGQQERQRLARLAATDDSCAATGLVTGEEAAPDRGYQGLGKVQVRNAHTVWVVGTQMGMGQRGATIGIATAMQESTLHNIDYGDRDSLGLFQQRPSMGWGTVKQVTNPVYAARKFFEGLKQVKGWRAMPLTVAAQRVQVSAFPNAYAKHERLAAGLVNLFSSGQGANANLASPKAQAQLNAGMCTAAGGDAASCPASGLGVEQGLTPDALRVLRCTHTSWPGIRSYGGVGDRPANVDRDHQQGRAVDVMIPRWSSISGKGMGEAIAAWAVKNRAKLGVKYVIWNGRIWSVKRADEGWRACGSSQASCYAGTDDTAAHRDHVHISVYGNSAGSLSGGGWVVLPVRSYVLTARFGECSAHWANCHTGLDFSAGFGTPIRAVQAGTVSYAGWGGDYGNLTKIDHGDGTASWYAHQFRTVVTPGQRVMAGQHIGYVGAVGNTTGPHLHLEIRIRGRAIDPRPWLSARGARP